MDIYAFQKLNPEQYGEFTNIVVVAYRLEQAIEMIKKIPHCDLGKPIHCVIDEINSHEAHDVEEIPTPKSGPFKEAKFCQDLQEATEFSETHENVDVWFLHVCVGLPEFRDDNMWPMIISY